jgi:hypothetical protein
MNIEAARLSHCFARVPKSHLGTRGVGRAAVRARGADVRTLK